MSTRSQAAKAAKQVSWVYADQKHKRHVKVGMRLQLVGSTCIALERRRGVYVNNPEVTVVQLEWEDSKIRSTTQG